jgi:hypothetical protein
VEKPAVEEAEPLPTLGNLGWIGDRLPMKGLPLISRADVAAFMLDAARGTQWVQRDAVITD